MSADIEGFFPSISIGRVEVALLSVGIRPDVAPHLAKFLTINGSLPLGLNSSPLIANVVAHALDLAFTAFADERGITYTRYADDLTFSGSRVAHLPSRQEIAAVLSAHQFRLNQAKYRKSKRGQRHYVTGLSVDDRNWPHAPRKMKRRLRQELHFIRKFGIESHLSRLKGFSTEQHHINRLDGTVSYISSVEPKLGETLRPTWEEICLRERVERSFEPRALIQLRKAHWFIDEVELSKPDGSKCLALCCAELHELQVVEELLAEIQAEEAGDAFGARPFHLHWNEANFSQRERVAKVLGAQPIRAVVALRRIPRPADYESVYCELLRTIMDRVMRSADDAVVTIVVEQNSGKVAQTQIRQTISDVFGNLVDRNRRRPVREPDVAVESKGTREAMFVPDALLGAMVGYSKAMEASEPAETKEVLLFERLRPRYALILDLDSGLTYKRTRPFLGWRE